MSFRTADLLAGPQTRRSRFGVVLFLLLALSMAVTRDHHFSNALHLADTSWAVFLLAGLYLRPRWMLPALLSLAVAVDLFAVWQDGLVLSGCFSPAYPGLLLAYGALWGAGRLARRDWTRLTAENPNPWMMALTLGGWITLAVLIAFVISNMTFWGFSGHFTSMSLETYASRVDGYLAGYLQTTLLYTAVAIVGVMTWAAIASSHTSLDQRAGKPN